MHHTEDKPTSTRVSKKWDLMPHRGQHPDTRLNKISDDLILDRRGAITSDQSPEHLSTENSEALTILISASELHVSCMYWYVEL